MLLKTKSRYCRIVQESQVILHKTIQLLCGLPGLLACAGTLKGHIISGSECNVVTVC